MTWVNTLTLTKVFHGPSRVSTYVIIVFTFCVTVSLSLTSYRIYTYNNLERQKSLDVIAQFDAQFDEIFSDYFAMLHGVRTFITSVPTLSLDGWHKYAKAVISYKRYPGIYGIGIVRPVLLNDLEDFIAHDYRQNGRQLTIQSDKLTLKDNPELGIVHYSLTPYSPLNEADGRDVRRTAQESNALDYARDNDQMQLVYMKTLNVADPTYQVPAFIIYLPIYNDLNPESSTPLRRVRHIAWITAPILIPQFINSVIKQQDSYHNLRITLSLPSTQHEDIYNHTPLGTPHETLHTTVSMKSIGDLNFTLKIGYFSREAFFSPGSFVLRSTELFFLLISIVISLLITLVIWSILTMHQRAHLPADALTANFHQQDRKNHLLIDSVPGILFTTAPGSVWEMTYLSDQFFEITGYNVADFTLERKRYFNEIIHPGDRKKVEEVAKHRLKADHQYFIDYRIIHANGSIRWLHERAKTLFHPETGETFVTGYFFDITKQKNNESDSRNLVKALENAVDGMAFIKATGYHARVNEAYVKIAGLRPRDLIYTAFLNILSDKDKRTFLQHINLFKQGQGERFAQRVEARTFDDRSIHLSLTLVPVYQEDTTQSFLGYYVFARDISSEALHERELATAVKEAEAANKAKSTFLATMSHELRTPLNAIIGYSDMLLEDVSIGDGDKISAHDIEKINAAGRHLLTLINDILDVSKLEAGKMLLHLETIDIKATILNVTAMMQSSAERNANDLILDCPDTIGVMFGDLTKIRQIIFNILSNACKFTTKGTINLRIRSFYCNEQEYIHLAVTDNGIGITADQLEKLFLPFAQADSTTTRNYGGTGLGLTITKKFTEMMAGQITVHSKPNRGTTFVIVLPRQIPQAALEP